MSSQTHECTKNDCYFCYITTERKARQETVMHAVTVKKSPNETWDRYEIDIVFANINSPYETIEKLLQGRSRNAIANCKVIYKDAYGYEYHGSMHKWVKI